MRVLFRLWVVFAAIWLIIVATAFRNGGPIDGYQMATIIVVPLAPLLLGLALRWAFKGAHS